MTHFSQQDNFSVAARVLGALFYYAPESAEAAPLVAVLTRDGWETQWPLPEASLAPLVTAANSGARRTGGGFVADGLAEIYPATPSCADRLHGSVANRWAV